MDGIAGLKSNKGERFSTKQMEKSKKSVEVRLATILIISIAKHWLRSAAIEMRRGHSAMSHLLFAYAVNESAYLALINVQIFCMCR